MQNSIPKPPVPWTELTEEERKRLRTAYGHFLDELPPMCSLADRKAQFTHWLDERGVAYHK